MEIYVELCEQKKQLKINGAVKLQSRQLITDIIKGTIPDPDVSPVNQTQQMGM